MSPAVGLRALKREVFLEIQERLTDLHALGAQVGFLRRPDAMWLDVPLPEGARGCIALTTIKDGLPAGQFAIDPTTLAYSGPLMSVLRRLPLRPWAHPPQDALLAAQTATAEHPRGVIPIESLTSDGIGHVCTLVTETCVPLLTAFGTRSVAALDHTLAHPQEVAAPFSTAALLALSNGLDDRLDDLVDLALSRPAFWDAAYVPDARAHVEAIRDAMSTDLPEGGPAF